MKIFYIFLILFAPIYSVGQQDVHFSQFNNTPLSLNPAAAGAFEGKMRFLSNYRNQWNSINSPHKTFVGSFDMPFKMDRNKYGNSFIGMGFNAYSDKAGDTDFSTFKFDGNVDYALDMGGTVNNPHYLSVGIGIGFLQRSLNLGVANWETQWNGTEFSNTTLNQEKLKGAQSETDVDAAIGTYWYYSMDDYKRILLGLSALHANAPEVGIFGDDKRLFRKYVFSGSMIIADRNRNIKYMPSLMGAFHGPNLLINIGGEAEFELQQKTKSTNYRNGISFNLGAYYRYRDAIYFTSKVNFKNYTLGFGYDYTVSKLKKANNGRGGIEILLGFRLNDDSKDPKRQKLKNSKGL
jgi:type IX secretion system PorP/SprF family membrane protein